MYDCMFLMHKPDGTSMFLKDGELVEFAPGEIARPDSRFDWEHGVTGAMWITRLFHPSRTIHHFHPGNTIHGVHGWSEETGSRQDNNKGRVPEASKSSKENGIRGLSSGSLWG